VQERLTELLRTGEADPELSAFVADVLDPKKKTHYKLIVQRRKAGKPQQEYDWDIYLDVERCKTIVLNSGKRVSAKSILDAGSEIRDLRTQTFTRLSEKTILKYLKFIEVAESVSEGNDV
jgi:hypothetical protein